MRRSPIRLKNLNALHTGFAGCGTTVAAARQSPAYLHSLASYGNPDAALVDALGEALIEKSWAGLPPGCDFAANAWQFVSADEQLKILRGLYDRLWIDPDTQPPVSDENEQPPFLPEDIGEWGDPTVPRRSCLGMAILPCAWAHKAGAEYLVGSVQRMAGEPVALGMKKLYGQAHQFIAQFLPTTLTRDPFPGNLLALVDDAIASSEIMTMREEFHGADLIRLRDGRWVSIDRYWNNFTILDPIDHPVDYLKAGISHEPSAVASMLGLPKWREERRLETSLAKVCRFLEQVLAGELIDPGLSLLQLPEALRQATETHCGLKIPFTNDVIFQQATAPMEGDRLDVVAARAMISVADHEPDRLYYRDRILLAAMSAWGNKVWEAAQYARAHTPHSAMIISHAARTLGVWAVINLRHREGKPWASDLLWFSQGDVVAYNAAADLHRENSLSLPEREILERRFNQYRRASPEFLHPLLLSVL